MKKLLFATVFASTALASSMGCNTDTLTGLHFGLGVSVLFDKYEADVDVATIQQNSLTTASVATAEVPSTTGGAFASGKEATFGEFVKGMWEKGDSATVGKDFVGDAGGTSYTIATNSLVSKEQLAGAFIKRYTVKKRTTNCGGEVKLAYFHDFGNHLMVGVDLTGIIASKNKKSIKLSSTTINPANILTVIRDEAQEGDPTKIATVDISGTGVATFEADAALGKAAGKMILSNTDGLKAANPDYTIMTKDQLDGLQENYALKTAEGSEAELTFEKSVFNPRLAFIVGGTIYGWFAGLRMGMSYTTGKVYATGGTGLGQDKMSKTVSISSPLIGLHLMKQMKIAGNNDAHLYLTADWNIGDGHRKVDINGVKSFKQSGYNISAGLTWRFKLGN